MQEVNALEMRDVNGGWHYWCTRCKKYVGWTLWSVGCHAIGVHKTKGTGYVQKRRW